MLVQLLIRNPNKIRILSCPSYRKLRETLALGLVRDWGVDQSI